MTGIAGFFPASHLCGRNTTGKGGPMKLSEQIEQFKASRQIPPEIAATMRGGVESVRATGAAGLNIGERAPDFTLLNQVGKTVRLADRLAEGPVVLSFYRGEW
jgi:hypothetical protein